MKAVKRLSNILIALFMVVSSIRTIPNIINYKKPIEKGIVLAGKIADAERLIRKDIEEEVAARGNAKRKILDDELL